MIKYESFLTNETHVNIQNGNLKLGRGIYSINLLAGDMPLTKKDGTQLTNVHGTCGGCCTECKSNCYAIKTQVYRNKNIPRWADNTLLARHDVNRFFDEIQSFIDNNIVSAIRYHSFGEIPSYEYLLHMVEIAKRNEDVRFYTYTKRFEWLEKCIETYGDLPSNLVINVSIWHNNYNNPYNLPEFIYDDGTDAEVAKLPHCPAVDSNGKETGFTCAQCKRCLKAKKGNRIAVYSH